MTSSSAQPAGLTGEGSAPTSGVSREVLDSIGTPSRVLTRIGELEFFDGLPADATAASVYDQLDVMRGVEVFLSCLTAASNHAMREGFRSVGIHRCNQIGVVDRLDSAWIYLTGNTETAYGVNFLDLKTDGPTVVDVPPNSLGFVDDFWFGFVADLGNAGPDRGQGGRYLFLPPGWDGEVPDGYFVYRSPTYANWFLIRAMEGLEALRAGVRIYPLAQANAPAPTEFISIAGVPHNTVHANNFEFFTAVDSVVQDEPIESLDAERRGLLASIGIVKGKPFAPDDRLRARLVEAAALGNATARTLAFKPRDPLAYYYPDSSWKNIWPGGSPDFLVDGVRLLDARAAFFYIATGNTPAMTVAMPGVGSQYAWTAEDASGAWLDGSRRYRLTLPPDIPAKNFWSIIVYDPQTRSLLQTDDRYPSLNSLTGTVAANADGSIDLYFGPDPDDDHNSNWIRTVPGKGWFTFLRLYGPLDPWFDKTWRPGEIERID